MNMRSSSRRGGVYPLVLIVSATAAASVLTGLAIRKAGDDRRAITADLADARLLARTGVESALGTIAENADWRDAAGASRTFTLPFEPGEINVTVSDPADGDLANNDADSFRVRSVGTVRNARAALQVDVLSAADLTYREHLERLEPIAWWPLDESTSTNIARALAGPQDGGYTLNVVPNTTTGPDARPAPTFDVWFKTAFVPHFDGLLLDDGTIVCHFRCDGNTTGDQVILSKDVEGENGPGSIQIFVGRDDLRLTVRLESSTRTAQRELARVNPGVWYHVAVAFGDDGLHAYLDGNCLVHETGFRTGLGPEAGGSGNTHNLIIGAWFDGSNFGRSLNGSVRDVAFFNRQLSEDEIRIMIDHPDAPQQFAIDPSSWAWLTN